MSLSLRFLLGFALVSSIGLYVLIASVIKRVERQYMEAAEEPMVDVANVLAEMAAIEMRETGSLTAERMAQAWASVRQRKLNAQIYHFKKQQVDMDVYVTDAARRIVYDSAGRERVGEPVAHRDVVLTLGGQYGARATYADRTDVKSVVLYVGAPIVVDGKTVGVVSVAKPFRSLLAFVEVTESWLKAMAMLAIAATLMGLYLASRWATRPLDQLTQHALAVSEGKRAPPPRMPGRHLKVLAKALEEMRDALEGREYVENYVQSLTHELKSPVAAIAGAAEILQGDVPEVKRARFLANIRTEAGRLQDLLERLLHLAALEKKKTLESAAPVDLKTVVNRAWDHLALMAGAKGVDLRLSPSEAAMVKGDGWLLELAVGNLLQNAVDFAPKGSRIEARMTRRDGEVALEICDQGPGVPEYARERVFERFYSLPRPDTGKKSSGLGLCFVKEIAQLHGGGVELTTVDGRGGARAVMRLPAVG